MRKPNTRVYSLPIIIEHDADGYFASCPDLQGCYSQGSTYEEAVSNIKDTVMLHIADRVESNEDIVSPRSVSLSTIEVTV
jgi:predicted RNase H-like HicB family nuclease